MGNKNHQTTKNTQKKAPISMAVGKANDLKRVTIDGKVYAEVDSLINYFTFCKNNNITPPTTKQELGRVIDVLVKCNNIEGLPEKPLIADKTQP